MEDMKKVSAASLVMLFSVLIRFANAQENDLVLGDWYFTKATNASGQEINHFSFFGDVTFLRRGGIVINQLQNSELLPKESFEYYVEKGKLVLVRTRTNLDPTYAIRFIDFNRMILERDNAFLHFERILRQKKIEDTTFVFLQHDTLTLFKKPFIIPRFKGDICRVLSDQFDYLRADTTGLLPVTFLLSGLGIISDIQIDTNLITAARADSVKAGVMRMSKYWWPAHRGAKKIDSYVRLLLLVKSRNTLSEFNYANVIRLMNNASRIGRQLQSDKKLREAAMRYRDVLSLFEFIEQSMIYSKKGFDIAALDAYEEALLGASELAVGNGDPKSACVLIGKIKRSNARAEKLYLVNCAK